MEIKNLKKVAERILKAIKNKEKIILYGDADLDGAASVIILRETIKNLNGQVKEIYFPDRELEGYGISEKGLQLLKKHAPALLIALDCGTGNFKEVKLAKKLGFEVIIIDHHEILDRLPEASVVVNPKQKGDKYPFKALATAGIAFKLSELLLKNKITENLRRSFLELVALATIADMMPQESENKVFIEEGLKSLESSWRPGIQAFLQAEPFKNYPDFRQKISKIISILNVRDVQNNFPASFRVLTTSTLEEVKEIIKGLLVKSELRKEKIEAILQELEERIFKKINTAVIFDGDSSWELTLLSPVASKVCQKYMKPCFIFSKGEKESQGVARTPSGIDGVKAMKNCSKLLETYGGHPLAGGFRIKNGNLERFKKCLIDYFRRN